MSSGLALVSSLLWGAGDFLGGRESRTFSVLRVLAWSQLATFAIMWIVVAIAVSADRVELTWHAIGFGGLGGCAGVIGLAAFYRALAIGPMAVVPPIAAAGVVLPVIVGLASGAAPTTWVVVGLTIAVIGVVLASSGEGNSSNPHASNRVAPSTIGLCLIAATGFALIFVTLDIAAGDSAWSALVATAGVRTGSLGTLVIALVLTRTDPRAGVSARDVLRFGLIGVLDTGANLLFAIAAALGELEVVAVLGSLYPAVTSGLALVVLGDRLGRLQLIGVSCALVGVLLLAGQ